MNDKNSKTAPAAENSTQEDPQKALFERAIAAQPKEANALKTAEEAREALHQKRRAKAKAKAKAKA